MYNYTYIVDVMDIILQSHTKRMKDYFDLVEYDCDILYFPLWPGKIWINLSALGHKLMSHRTLVAISIDHD
jgi:hypothetical protein